MIINYTDAKNIGYRSSVGTVWFGVGAPDPIPPIPPVPPVIPEDPAPDALRDFDINLFLGDAYVTPDHGLAPLEVQFYPGNPYDAINEVSTNFSYIIIESSDGIIIIREDPI